MRGLPLQLALPAVGPAVGAWYGGARPLTVGLAECRGWGPGLASQGLFFFFLFGCQAPGASLNIILKRFQFSPIKGPSCCLVSVHPGGLGVSSLCPGL